MADRRVKKTRSALEDSFNRVFLAEGYESATPARVARDAKVGRSTFYEHYTGRDDLLEQRLAVVLRPLADAACCLAVPPELEPMLQHFWSNRVITRRLLAGRARSVVIRSLTILIEERISSNTGKIKPVLRSALAGSYIAGGQVAMLEEWLLGRCHCTAGVLASGLHASSHAAASAVTNLPDR